MVNISLIVLVPSMFGMSIEEYDSTSVLSQNLDVNAPICDGITSHISLYAYTIVGSN